MAQRSPPPRARKVGRLKEFDYSDESRAYFVPLRAKKGTRPFESQELARDIFQGLECLRENRKCSVFAYCLMPDHLHLVLSPIGGKRSVSDLIRDFKSHTTRCSWRLGGSGPLWQRSFYDHVGRRREDLVKMCEYILGNPVRAGFVESVSSWPYSGRPDPLPW